MFISVFIPQLDLVALWSNQRLQAPSYQLMDLLLQALLHHLWVPPQSLLQLAYLPLFWQLTLLRLLCCLCYHWHLLPQQVQSQPQPLLQPASLLLQLVLMLLESHLLSGPILPRLARCHPLDCFDNVDLTRNVNRYRLRVQPFIVDFGREEAVVGTCHPYRLVGPDG